jgi:hypothetical protein
MYNNINQKIRQIVNDLIMMKMNSQEEKERYYQEEKERFE